MMTISATTSTATGNVTRFAAPLMMPLIIAFALAGCTTMSQTEAKEGPVALGETAYVDGPHVTPLEIVEDSRCPTDVQCVWAGQVRLRVRVTGGAWTKELELVNAKSVAVADGSLTLTNVTPAPSSTREIAKTAYRFTFRFEGGL